MNATFMTNATIQRFKRKQDAGKPVFYAAATYIADINLKNNKYNYLFFQLNFVSNHL